MGTSPTAVTPPTTKAETSIAGIVAVMAVPIESPTRTATTSAAAGSPTIAIATAAAAMIAGVATAKAATTKVMTTVKAMRRETVEAASPISIALTSAIASFIAPANTLTRSVAYILATRIRRNLTPLAGTKAIIRTMTSPLEQAATAAAAKQAAVVIAVAAATMTTSMPMAAGLSLRTTTTLARN